MDNPFKSQRLTHALSQQSVADQIHISRQMILRLEQGTMNLPPVAALRYFSELSGLPESYLLRKYSEWQSYHRFSNREVVANALSNAETYKEFRILLRGSVAGLSKMLCIEASMWDRLERRGGNNEFFIRAMEDIGLGEEAKCLTN